MKSEYRGKKRATRNRKKSCSPRSSGIRLKVVFMRTWVRIRKCLGRGVSRSSGIVQTQGAPITNRQPRLFPRLHKFLFICSFVKWGGVMLKVSYSKMCLYVNVEEFGDACCSTRSMYWDDCFMFCLIPSFRLYLRTCTFSFYFLYWFIYYVV